MHGTRNSKHRELKTTREQVSTLTHPWACWIRHLRRLLQLKKENVNSWWSEQTYFIWITSFVITTSPTSFPAAAEHVWDADLGSPTRHWTPGPHPTVLSTWEVPTSLSLVADEKTSAKSWPQGGCFRAHKCSTCLVWVNSGLGLRDPGRKHIPEDGAARGRSEPDPG